MFQSIDWCLPSGIADCEFEAILSSTEYAELHSPVGTMGKRTHLVFAFCFYLSRQKCLFLTVADTVGKACLLKGEEIHGVYIGCLENGKLIQLQRPVYQCLGSPSCDCLSRQSHFIFRTCLALATRMWVIVGEWAWQWAVRGQGWDFRVRSWSGLAEANTPITTAVFCCPPFLTPLLIKTHAADFSPQDISPDSFLVTLTAPKPSSCLQTGAVLWHPPAGPVYQRSSRERLQESGA